jgi:hypothetical protein
LRKITLKSFYGNLFGWTAIVPPRMA